MKCVYCMKKPATHSLIIKDFKYYLCEDHQCICGTKEKGSHLCEVLDFLGEMTRYNNIYSPQNLSVREVSSEMWSRGLRTYCPKCGGRLAITEDEGGSFLYCLDARCPYEERVG